MLLSIAEMKKPILPVSFLGGVAQELYYRKRHSLLQLLGEGAEALQDSRSADRLLTLAEQLATADELGSLARGIEPRFFISYSRERPAEADYVETLPRRQNKLVFRDDKDFGAGSDLPASILEEIRGTAHGERQRGGHLQVPGAPAQEAPGCQ